jgi:hypothetical protein
MANPPSVTEAKFARLVVHFANTGQLTGALLTTPGLRVLVPMDSGGKKLVQRDVVMGHVPTEELERLRKRLREVLTAITRDTVGAKDLQWLSDDASALKIEPSYQVDKHGKLTATYTYFPPGISAAISYGVLVIADTARALRADLKQCRLERCGCFFFSSDSPAATGRDRARYCTPEHMIEAHKATSAERTRRWRERKARKQK